jgi:hypothetical protein
MTREELIAGYADGSLAVPELRELAEAARADAATADLLAEDLAIHRFLRFSQFGSDALDRRSAERILHFVRASLEAPSFAERVKRNAADPGRRRAWRRRSRPARSALIPGLVAAGFLAALAAAVVHFSARPAPRRWEESRRAAEARLAELEALRFRAEQEEARLEEERARELARLEAIRSERRALLEAQKVEEARRQAELEEEVRRGLERLESARREADARREEAQVAKRRAEEDLVRAAPAAPTAPGERPVAARLEAAEGRVEVDGAPASSPMKVLAGQGVRAAASPARAEVAFEDGTRLRLSGETWIRDLFDFEKGTGKRVFLAQGVLAAEVARQPGDRPMIVTTPQAEVRVLGTTLRVVVDPRPTGSTRVEVREGRVRVIRREDGRSVEVGPDHFAVVARGLTLSSRPLPKPYLVDDFENPRATAARWTAIQGNFALGVNRRLEIDLTPRRPGVTLEPCGLMTREAFRLPFRVSLEMEAAPAGPDMDPGVVFIPARQPDELEAFWVDHYPLSSRTFRLADERTKGVIAAADAPADVPRRERWTIEIEGDEVRVSLDGREVLKARHGKRVFEAYHVRIESNAGANVPAGARVFYDNVRIEPLSREK